LQKCFTPVDDVNCPVWRTPVSIRKTAREAHRGLAAPLPKSGPARRPRRSSGASARRAERVDEALNRWSGMWHGSSRLLAQRARWCGSPRCRSACRAEPPPYAGGCRAESQSARAPATSRSGWRPPRRNGRPRRDMLPAFEAGRTGRGWLYGAVQAMRRKPNAIDRLGVPVTQRAVPAWCARSCCRTGVHEIAATPAPPPPGYTCSKPCGPARALASWMEGTARATCWAGGILVRPPWENLDWPSNSHQEGFEQFRYAIQ